MRVVIDTVDLGRTRWLRMRWTHVQMLPATRVWLWDEALENWRPPAMVDSF